jgi:hypothetical protein
MNEMSEDLSSKQHLPNRDNSSSSNKDVDHYTYFLKLL